MDEGAFIPGCRPDAWRFRWRGLPAADGGLLSRSSSVRVSQTELRRKAPGAGREASTPGDVATSCRHPESGAPENAAGPFRHSPVLRDDRGSGSVKPGQTNLGSGSLVETGWGRAVPAPGKGWGRLVPTKAVSPTQSNPVKVLYDEIFLDRGFGFQSENGSRGRSPHLEPPAGSEWPGSADGSVRSIGGSTGLPMDAAYYICV